MTIHVTTRCACGGRGVLCDDDFWGDEHRWSVECDTCDAMGPARPTPGGADRAWRIMHGGCVSADEMRNAIREEGDGGGHDEEDEGDSGGEGGETLHVQCAYWSDAPAPSAVVVTVEVRGEERTYECRPVDPAPPQPDAWRPTACTLLEVPHSRCRAPAVKECLTPDAPVGKVK